MVEFLIDRFDKGVVNRLNWYMYAYKHLRRKDVLFTKEQFMNPITFSKKPEDLYNAFELIECQKTVHLQCLFYCPNVCIGMHKTFPRTNSISSFRTY